MPHRRQEEGHQIIEYTIRSDYATYVATEQHARSTPIRVPDLATGEVKSTRLSSVLTTGKFSRDQLHE